MTRFDEEAFPWICLASGIVRPQKKGRGSIDRSANFAHTLSNAKRVSDPRCPTMSTRKARCTTGWLNLIVHFSKILQMAVARKGENWTRAEHILAFNLYCKIPFGTIHVRNPKIIELAELLGRSVGSVSRKLANFSRLDPWLKARGVRGLPHGAKGEVEVWNEFYENPEALVFESERLLAERMKRPLEQIAEIDESELPREGRERERLVRMRINQHFFRAAVLSAYDYRCCVTGLAIPELLNASHIVPWSADLKNAVNPRNGLCLNVLHDRAFDRGLMFIDEEWKVRFRFRNAMSNLGLRWLTQFEGRKISLPSKFPPDPALLAKHRNSSLREEPL